MVYTATGLLAINLLALKASAAIIPVLDGLDAAVDSQKSDDSTPLLIWHGLGDSYDSEGMKSVATLYQTLHPHATVHSIALAESGSSDRQASWFGSLNSQLNETCHALRSHSTLGNATGVNAVGFSQGGQFLRALVERCNVPPVRNLLTFGSQHNGIARFQSCAPADLLCRSWSSVLQGNAWSEFAQIRLVPAQYFRDPEDLERYLENSAFLADVNNERANKSAKYRRNVESLDRFVMYVFDDDEVVRPKESSWFSEVNMTTGEVTGLRNRAIYKEDWLGLKTLDEKGGLFFETAAGKHMQIGDKLLKKAFEKYFKPGKAGESLMDVVEDVASETQKWIGSEQMVFASVV